MRIFITGIAGFIGFHVAKALHYQGHNVAGIDNFNPYYDPKLKEKRAEMLASLGIQVAREDICSKKLNGSVEAFQPTHLLHLAAQAGVRYSLQDPMAYVKANLEGFLNILEIVRNDNQIKLVYASSSSVYGLNAELPYSTKDRTDHPASFYGATKKSNELMAASYHHLFNVRSIGLRYFTVYGPWGRPDMALFGFTKAIIEERSIDLYNFGKMQRDFTYIDDIVAGTISALFYEGEQKIFNLGNHAPATLEEFVDILEAAIGKKAKRNLLPLQPGDVLATYADIEDSRKELGFMPKTSLKEGIGKFVAWYKEYAKGGT